MDNAKAIDLLDNLIGMIDDNQNNDYDAAFRMAIDALKTQLYREDATSDLISRQAAIDAVMRDVSCIRTHEFNAGATRAANRIKQLPSAQPDHIADINKKVSYSCGQENDVIFRQAAIDALARMMPRSYTPDGSHPADEEIFRAQEVIADCIEALEILSPAQPETHWISCSERLPEHGGRYLVSVLDGINRRTTVAPYMPRCKAWTMTGRMTYWKVIAWMPLPAPYKGGETE